MKTSAVFQLLTYVIGEEEAQDVMANTYVGERLLDIPARGSVERAAVAQTFALALWHDLLRRTPSARRYAYEFKPATEKLELDHLAVHTVRFADNTINHSGPDVVRQLLGAMGFAIVDSSVGQLNRDSVRVYRHQEFDDQIPRIIVKEHSMGALSASLEKRAIETFSLARDPMPAQLTRQMKTLESTGSLPFHDAADIVLKGTRFLDRHHDLPRLDDHEALEKASADIAWMSTEGQACAYAAIRVTDPAILSKLLTDSGFEIDEGTKSLLSDAQDGFSLKPDGVSRRFRGPASSFVEKEVPGSSCRFVKGEILDQSLLASEDSTGR